MVRCHNSSVGRSSVKDSTLFKKTKRKRKIRSSKDNVLSEDQWNVSVVYFPDSPTKVNKTKKKKQPHFNIELEEDFEDCAVAKPKQVDSPVKKALTTPKSTSKLENTTQFSARLMNSQKKLVECNINSVCSPSHIISAGGEDAPGASFAKGPSSRLRTKRGRPYFCDTPDNKIKTDVPYVGVSRYDFSSPAVRRSNLSSVNAAKSTGKIMKTKLSSAGRQSNFNRKSLTESKKNAIVDLFCAEAKSVQDVLYSVPHKSEKQNKLMRKYFQDEIDEKVDGSSKTKSNKKCCYLNGDDVKITSKTPYVRLFSLGKTPLKINPSLSVNSSNEQYVKPENKNQTLDNTKRLQVSEVTSSNRRSGTGHKRDSNKNTLGVRNEAVQENSHLIVDSNAVVEQNFIVDEVKKQQLLNVVAEENIPDRRSTYNVAERDVPSCLNETSVKLHAFNETSTPEINDFRSSCVKKSFIERQDFATPSTSTEYGFDDVSLKKSFGELQHFTKSSTPKSNNFCGFDVDKKSGKLHNPFDLRKISFSNSRISNNLNFNKTRTRSVIKSSSLESPVGSETVKKRRTHELDCTINSPIVLKQNEVRASTLNLGTPVCVQTNKKNRTRELDETINSPIVLKANEIKEASISKLEVPIQMMQTDKDKKNLTNELDDTVNSLMVLKANEINVSISKLDSPIQKTTKKDEKNRTRELNDTVNSPIVLKANEISESPKKKMALPDILEALPKRGQLKEMYNDKQYSNITLRRKSRVFTMPDLTNLDDIEPPSNLNISMNDSHKSSDSLIEFIQYEQKFQRSSSISLTPKKKTASRKSSLSTPKLAKSKPNELYKNVLNKNTDCLKSFLPVKAKTSAKTKMPNFAEIHRKAAAEMEDISAHCKRKAERAKQLLSGCKPKQINGKENGFNALSSASIKSDAKPTPTGFKFGRSIQNDFNKVIAAAPLSSASIKNDAKPTPTGFKFGRLMQKDLIKVIAAAPGLGDLGKSKTPNPFEPVTSSTKLNVIKQTRFGFKCEKVTRKEDLVKAVANKTRVKKTDVTSRMQAIKGVRSNRRFDLLMKMRQK